MQFFREVWRTVGLAMVATLAGGVLAMVLVSHNHRTWQDTMWSDLPVLNRLSQAKSDLAEGHLWLEELLAGDPAVDYAAVDNLLGKAQDAVLQAAQGTWLLAGVEPGQTPAGDSPLTGELRSLALEIGRFRQSALQRWRQGRLAGVGTELDQDFDREFIRIIQQARHLENRAEVSLVGAMDRNAHQHILIMSGILLATLAGLVALVWLGRQQARARRQRLDLEEQLRHSQKMEAIGTLAGGVAHDFNNVLAAIMGYTELVLGRATSPGDIRDLERILRATERARDLVRQILAFSRRSEFCLTHVDLNRVINQALDLLRPTIPRMVELELALGSGLPPVLADAGGLEQILLNLTSNAVDAMPAGGTIFIGTRLARMDQRQTADRLEMPPGTYAHLRFSDNGEGMTHGVQERIYDPFFTTKPVGSGTGLGLSTVFGMVKSFQGHIFCHSEQGWGTTFSIYLPACAPGTRAAPAEACLTTDRVDLRGVEILLVDDEPMLREVGRELLRQAGARVHLAATGEEALMVQAGLGPRLGLVILDLNMPGMGGRRCLLELKRRDPHCRVLVSSGYSLDADPRQLMAEGAAGYVAKPFRHPELLSLVGEVLASPAATNPTQPGSEP